MKNISHFKVKNCFRSGLFPLRTLGPWELAIEFSGIINTVLGVPHSSVGKESACNAGDPSVILGSGRSTGEGIGYSPQYSWASLVAQLVKESSYNMGDLGSIPGLGRSPGEGKGYPLQYSGQENSMDWIVRGVTKSQT